MQAIGGRIQPQHRVGAIAGGRRQGLPAGINTLINGIALDRDRLHQAIDEHGVVIVSDSLLKDKRSNRC